MPVCGAGSPLVFHRPQIHRLDLNFKFFSPCQDTRFKFFPVFPFRHLLFPDFTSSRKRLSTISETLSRLSSESDPESVPESLVDRQTLNVVFFLASRMDLSLCAQSGYSFNISFLSLPAFSASERPPSFK